MCKKIANCKKKRWKKKIYGNRTYKMRWFFCGIYSRKYTFKLIYCIRSIWIIYHIDLKFNYKPSSNLAVMQWPTWLQLVTGWSTVAVDEGTSTNSPIIWNLKIFDSVELANYNNMHINSICRFIQTIKV